MRAHFRCARRLFRTRTLSLSLARSLLYVYYSGRLRQAALKATPHCDSLTVIHSRAFTRIIIITLTFLYLSVSSCNNAPTRPLSTSNSSPVCSITSATHAADPSMEGAFSLAVSYM
jgi:hypothetical protein